MEVKSFQPAVALRPIVRYILFIRSKTEKGSLLPINPFPPIPQHGLFFYLNDPIKSRRAEKDVFIQNPSVMLIGPQLQKVDITMGNDHFLVYVALQPGALFHLTHVPMHEVADMQWDASSIWTGQIEQLAERLKNATDDAQRVAFIDSFLWGKLKTKSLAEAFDCSIGELSQYGGNLPIEKVAAHACLSLRQFERKCQERLGMPPKVFARLIRFSKAYRLKESNNDFNWTKICYDCGYFDQAHFIRDFREFTGVSPRIIEKDLLNTPYRLQSHL